MSGGTMVAVVENNDIHNLQLVTVISHRVSKLHST